MEDKDSDVQSTKGHWRLLRAEGPSGEGGLKRRRPGTGDTRDEGAQLEPSTRLVVSSEEASEGAKCHVISGGSQAMLTKSCRLCFSEEGPNLISPCRCRGTQQFVHRECLDEWRVAKGKSAFFQCTVCGAEFYMSIPSKRHRLLLALGLSKRALRCLAAALVFLSMQVAKVLMGFLMSHRDVFTNLEGGNNTFRTRTLADKVPMYYCMGAWVLFVQVAAVSCARLAPDHLIWNLSINAFIIPLMWTILPFAIPSIFRTCYRDVPHLPPHFHWIQALPPLPYPISTLWNTPLRNQSCEGTTCGLYMTTILSSLVLGAMEGIFVAPAFVPSLDNKTPSVLVKEFVVKDVPGEYTPPRFSASDRQLLKALCM